MTNLHYQKNSLLTFVLVSIALFLVIVELGCATKVPIYDSEVCADVGNSGAMCKNQYTKASRDINKKSWDKERFGMLCLTSQGFTDLVTPIDQLCAVYKDSCVYSTREENAKAVFEKMNQVLKK